MIVLIIFLPRSSATIKTMWGGCEEDDEPRLVLKYMRRTVADENITNTKSFQLNKDMVKFL